MIGNLRPSEVCAVVAVLSPIAVVNVEAATGWVDTASWESVLFIALTGDMAAETVDFKLEQATSSGGAGKKDLLLATQFPAHATTSDGKQVMLQCRGEKLDIANNFRFVRARVITGSTVGGPMAIVGLGFNNRYDVGTDLASVAQIATV